MDKAERLGYHKGVRETKELLAEEFERIGSAGYNGYEIAALIRQAPGPKPDDKND